MYCMALTFMIDPHTDSVAIIAQMLRVCIRGYQAKHSQHLNIHSRQITDKNTYLHLSPLPYTQYPVALVSDDVLFRTCYA